MSTLVTTLGLASIRRGRMGIRKKWWAVKREYNHIRSACIRYLKKRKILR